MTCFAYNSELVNCAQKKLQCGIISLTPAMVQVAMETAFNQLTGAAELDPSEPILTPEVFYTTESEGFQPKTNPGNVKIEPVVLGKNAFPGLPPGVTLPPSLPKYKISLNEAGGK